MIQVKRVHRPREDGPSRVFSLHADIMGVVSGARVARLVVDLVITSAYQPHICMYPW